MIIGGAILLGLALLLNLSNKKMLALTFIVGAGFFMPVPRTGEWYEFYQWCSFYQICVALCAMVVKCHERWAVVFFSLLLLLCDALGYWKDGFPAFSPYRILVPTIEYLQIIACIVLSNPIRSRLVNHGPTIIR